MGGVPRPGEDASASLQPAESSFGAEPPAEPPRHDLRWVFVGREGIRAGWSALIFAGIFLGLLFGVMAVVKALVQRGHTAGPAGSPQVALINEAIEFVILIVATWVMSRIEHKPLLHYGYQGRARGVRFVSGLAWGFLAISVLVLSLEKLGYLAIEGRALGGAAALHFALFWGGVFLLVGFFEESLLRGYLQFTLTRGLGFWWGAILLSFLFGFAHGHNPGESPVGLFAAGAVGLVFCLSLWYTGSLWWAVGFHAAWDWGESYFYGTADSGMVAQGHLLREHPVGKILWSGGTTGPEGSVLVFALLAVMAALMVAWWGRRGEKPFAGRAWKGNDTGR
jgi:hypothetical protein